MLVTVTYVSWSSDFALSWRLFDVWGSYFGIMSQYDPTFDLKINVGHCDLYFMVQCFCLISWRLFDVWTSYFGIESVWQNIWPQNKCRSLWTIFHGPVILPYILKTIWYMNTILWDYESVYDPMFDLKIFVGHCELYFMVHWFCLVSWKLFSGWTSYFGIMGHMTQHLTSKYL